MSTILPHNGVALLRIYDAGLNVLQKPLTENTGRKKLPKIRHLRTIAQLCRAIPSQLSTIGKKMLNSNISPTCSYNTVNFGPLAAQIGSGVFQRRGSMEANQTLHDVWPSPGPFLLSISVFYGRPME